MQLNPNIRQLDDSLSAYISSNDPLRKSASRTVFMKKKQLFTFYSNMQFKANQELKLSQKENTSSDPDMNKVLSEQDQRKRQKLYHRTFYIKKQSSNTIHLNEKQSVNINPQPIICNQFSQPSKSKRNPQTQQKTISNQQSFSLKPVKQKFKCRKTRSLSHNLSLMKDPVNIKKLNQRHISISKKDLSNQESSQTISYKKFQLLQLYQKLYHQFQIQKMKNIEESLKIKNKSQRKKLILNRQSSHSLKNLKPFKNNKTQLKI